MEGRRLWRDKRMLLNKQDLVKECVRIFPRESKHYVAIFELERLNDVLTRLEYKYQS